MYTLLKDMQLAVRGLLKRPASRPTVTLTLALGLGANAAIFNLIDRLVLRPYPLPDIDRMVLLAETGPGIDTAAERCRRPTSSTGATAPARSRIADGDAVVGRQPGRSPRSRAACRAIIVSVGILRRPRHPAGARARLRARR